MTWQMALVCLVFVATITALVARWGSTARVFGLALCCLYGFGLVTTEQVMASVVHPGVITLVLLIVCSLALEKTLFLRWIASRVIRPDMLQTRLRLMLSTVLASAFLNNTAVVTALLSPIKNNPHHPPARLLILLSYFSILGGTLTLIGTSTNLVVNSLIIDAGLEPLSFFDFTVVGGALVIWCGALLLLMTPRGGHNKNAESSPSAYLIDAKVSAASTLIGKSIEENGLRHLDNLFLVELVRDGRLISPVAPSECIEQGDHLIFNGDVNKLLQITQISGLEIFSGDQNLMNSNLSEVLVRPESHLVGKTIKQLGFRARFDAAVVALKRDGERVSGKLGEVALQAGDFLVLAVGHDFQQRTNLLNNFVVVSGLEPEQRLTQAQERLAIAAFFAVIALAASGVLEFVKGLVLLFALYLLSGCLSTQEVRRRVPVHLWLIVATALLFSKAAIGTGLFDAMSGGLTASLSEWPVWAIVVMLYVITWLFTELVTNNAAAALMFPVALALAQALSIEPMILIMTMTFAASASFMSPYGYQTNLIVFNAGGYRARDFLRFGWPVALVYGLVVITLVPQIWG